MRLALTKNHNRNADIFCDEARFAKQKLQREVITQISIDHYLNGRESGYEFVRWAISKCVMPMHIVLSEINRERRKAMGGLLTANGYRSPDGMTFIKYR